MTSVRISIVIVAVIICAASATPPKARPVRTNTTVTAGYTDTWTALSEELTARNWKLVTNEQAAGLLETEWVTLTNPGHADCGSAPLGKDRDTKVHVVARVKREGERATTVTIEAEYQRLRKFDDSARNVKCTSKGTLEEELFAALDSRLKVIAVKKEKEREEASSAPFYCTAASADANTTWCARNEAACENGRTEIQKTIGEAAPCEKQKKAACFIGTNAEGVQVERCFTTPEQCTAQRTKVTTAPAQMTQVGECAAY